MAVCLGYHISSVMLRWAMVADMVGNGKGTDQGGTWEVLYLLLRTYTDLQGSQYRRRRNSIRSFLSKSSFLPFKTMVCNARFGQKGKAEGTIPAHDMKAELLGCHMTYLGWGRAGRFNGYNGSPKQRYVFFGKPKKNSVSRYLLTGRYFFRNTEKNRSRFSKQRYLT